MGGTPEAPDPYETARADSDANRFAANQNVWSQNFNEVNPYGSKNIAQTGSTKIYDPFSKQYIDQPTYTQTVNLSPAEQGILDRNTQMRTNMGDLGVSQSARMKGLLSKSVSTAGLQGWNAGPGVQPLRQDQGATDRKAVEDAMMQRYQRYAQPQNEAQDVEMAARGMDPGSQGYGSMKMAQGDQFANATREAFLASGDESRKAQAAYNQVAGQRFDMGGAAADRGNALRQAQLQERLGLRNQDYNEMAALAGLTTINNPQVQPYQGSTTQPVNIGQMIYDKYNADSEQYQNKMQGMFGVGQAVAGAMPWASWLGGLSDRRAKTDIVPIGADLAGVPLYTFRYWTDMDTTHVGVMADEAKAVHPDAVHMNGEDGYDYVDYAMLRRRHEH
jgi:hypothetical protein